MKCRDFETLWNELLDLEIGGGVKSRAPGINAARDGIAADDIEHALIEHAASCAPCRQVDARYQALRRAIRLWGPPPAPSAGLAERILEHLDTPAREARPVYGGVRRERNWAIIGLMTGVAAAIIIGLALPFLNQTIDRTRRDAATTALHPTPIRPHLNSGDEAAPVDIDARALNVALAEATSATWDLARSASEPAARLSRQVLDVATGPDQNAPQPDSVAGSVTVVSAVSVPSLDTLAPDTTAARAVLQQVGDRLTSGVRPLSATARHAFGFLLGTAPAKHQPPVNPVDQKGA
jgi:hypothetical protein